ncbi:unknown [Clostridium sp. CAG:793]|nr:unknown [Clostridium sp. CAG:793]
MNSKGIEARNAFKVGTVQYGTTSKSTRYTKYPAIYAQEKYSGINVSDVADGTQVITDSADATAQAKLYKIPSNICTREIFRSRCK